MLFLFHILDGAPAPVPQAFGELYKPCGRNGDPGPVAPIVSGGGDHGVAGSITASPILKTFEIIIKQGCSFGDNSFILDVGSGTGEFSLACLAIPGLEKFFSIGVEFQQSAYQVHS